MNKGIKVFASIMILISIALLVLIFTKYYSRSEYKTNNHTSGDNIIITNDENRSENKSTLISGESTIKVEPDLNKDSGDVSGEYLTQNTDITVNNNDKPTPKPVETKPQRVEKEPVITSNVETSNEEKRQVLNELDSTLKGLLDVVSKVPTVDETKLEASLNESEVTP